MPRLHHSSDCSTVSTFCTDNDLGSRVYNGIYRFSCYLTSTELEGDIGLTMSACSAAHHAFEFSARLQTNWWLWAFTGLINFWSRSAQVLLFPGLWSVDHFPLIGTKLLRASPARIYWWSLLGFVRTRVLMSRSRLNNGATHGGWHFDIHRDFDTRER